MEVRFNLFHHTFLVQITLNELIQLHFPPKFVTKNPKIPLLKHFGETLLCSFSSTVS